MGKIIAFSGSNSKSSINQQFVIAASALIDGHEVEVINLVDYSAPLFGVDLLQETGVPDTIQSLKQKMEEADGFLISSPEHNGSMPAFFKNTIDWLSMIDQKVFMEKPTVFLSTSPGPRGGVSALEHLVAIMPYRGAQVVGHYALGGFNDAYVDDKLTDAVQEELIEVIQKLEAAI